MKINSNRQDFYGVKPSTNVVRLATYLSWLIALILILLPFHAFLTVWLSSAVGHYTLLRLWKEFLLAIITAGAIYILAVDKPLRKKLLTSWPARLIGIYSLLFVVWGIVALSRDDVTAKAMWYGLLVNLRFLVFFLAVWVLAAKSDLLSRKWKKFLLAPAILVSAFAVLQYLVLPYDFLRHFGYGPSTISPYETINHNINHIRVASTLRGANPLGAYLIIPLSVLAISLIKSKTERKAGYILGVGFLLALIFSFSRSAWIGAGLSLLILVWVSLKKRRAKKMVALGLAVLVILGGLMAVVLRNNTTFENSFLHTDHTAQVLDNSNQGHAAAFKTAAKDIIRQPLGRGVGTAGPESVYNDTVRVAENYFLQIGQEAGVLGMALFIAICAVVAKQLWGRKSDPLALALFASLVGITFVNLLSHAWTDDTLAYIWWGLAGVAIATPVAKSRKLKADSNPAGKNT